MDDYDAHDRSFLLLPWRALPLSPSSSSTSRHGHLYKLSPDPGGDGGVALMVTDFEKVYFEHVKTRSLGRRLRVGGGGETQSQVDVAGWEAGWWAGGTAEVKDTGSWGGLDVELVAVDGAARLRFELEPLKDSPTVISRHLLFPALGALGSLLASGQHDVPRLTKEIDRSAMDALLRPAKLAGMFSHGMAGSMVARWAQSVAELDDPVPITEAEATPVKAPRPRPATPPPPPPRQPSPIIVEDEPVENSPVAEVSRPEPTVIDVDDDQTDDEQDPRSVARQRSSPIPPPSTTKAAAVTPVPEPDPTPADPSPAAPPPSQTSPPAKGKKAKTRAEEAEEERSRREEALRAFNAKAPAAKPKRRRF